MIADVLAAGDQCLVIVRGREEPAAISIGEALDHRVGGLARGIEPANLQGGLVEAEEPLHEERMVLQVGVQPAAALLPGPEQPTLRVAHRVEHEAGAGCAASR